MAPMVFLLALVLLQPVMAQFQPVMAQFYLALVLVQPVMAHVYLCWWRLRTYQGRMYFVHPDGWHELLDDWALDCLDILFGEEPEMAAYIVGMGQISDTVTWWPPTWHSGSQQWIISREPPDPESIHVAEPVDLLEWRPRWRRVPQQASDGYSASRTLDAPGMEWIYEQVNFGEPASDGSNGKGGGQASDGSNGKGGGQASDGSKGKGKGKASDGSKGKGKGKASDGSKGKGKGKASDGSTDAASSNDNPYICSWERRQHLGPSPVAPPNPDRFVARGFAASQRRLQRRQLARDGKTVPEHLQPRKVEISKSLKRQMWELQQRARKMACGELTEEDLLEEEEKNQEWIAMNKEEEEMERQKKKERLKQVKEEPDYEGDTEMEDVEEEEDEEKKEEEEEDEVKNASDGKAAPAKPIRQWHSSTKNKKQDGTPPEGGETGSLEKPEMASKSAAKSKPQKKPKNEEEPEMATDPPPDGPKGPPGPPGPPPDPTGGGAAVVATAVEAKAVDNRS